MSPRKSVATKKETLSSEFKKSGKISANEKKIGLKNYLLAVVIFIGGIGLTLLIFHLYNIKKEERLMISYLISSNTIESSISDLKSLNLIKQEAPSSYFVYLSYTQDEEIYNFERDLKKLIDKYKLNDIFYYVDLTDYKEKNDEYMNVVKDSLDTDNLKAIPAIVYIQDGKVVDVLDGVKNTKLKIADVEKLLDIYEFEAVN